MPLTPEALLSVFKSIDLDDSGTIELRELEAFCAPCLLGDGARQSSAQQSRITELFAQVDTDGSGVISFDEFCEARGHPASLLITRTCLLTCVSLPHRLADTYEITCLDFTHNPHPTAQHPLRPPLLR